MSVFFGHYILYFGRYPALSCPKSKFALIDFVHAYKIAVKCLKTYMHILTKVEKSVIMITDK